MSIDINNTTKNTNKIPKIIWQTYKTDYVDLPNRAKYCSDEWQRLNPDYEYRYMNDNDIEEFVEKYYGKKMLKLLKSFKVPVMKADLWRVLVVYQFGGVYSDIDTRPTESLSNWIDLSKGMIVGIENGLHYTQWSFMAEPKSKVLKSIIDVILERCKKIDYDMKDFIHYHTANDAFTEGIRRHFDLPDIHHECNDMKEKFNCFCGYLQEEAAEYYLNNKMKEEGFFCFSGNDWSTFRDGKIHHEFGSAHWDTNSYQTWINHPLAEKSRKYSE